MPQNLLRLGLVLISISQFLPEFISSYALLFWLLVCLWLGYREKKLGGIQVWQWALLAFFGWQLLGLTYSNHPKHGVELLGMQFLLLLLPLTLHLLPLNRRDLLALGLKSLWWCCLAASAYVTGYGIIRVCSEPGDYWFHASHYMYYTELSEPLMHPAYFSSLVVMALLGAFWLQWHKKLTGWWIWLLQAWLLVFMMLISARMSVLAFAISAVLLSLYLGWQAGNKRVVAASLMGAPLFALAVFWILPERLQQRFTELSQLSYQIDAPLLTDFTGLTIRLAEWSGVQTALHDHWLIGHGTGGGKAALQEAYQKIGFEVGLQYGYNAHNQFLETALHNGLIGVLLLLMVFITAFWHAFRRKNWLAMWLLLYFFMCIQTESMLVRHRGVLFMALYLSLCLLWDARKTSDNATFSAH
jgi:O-antigen ligase